MFGNDRADVLVKIGTIQSLKRSTINIVKNLTKRKTRETKKRKKNTINTTKNKT